MKAERPKRKAKLPQLLALVSQLLAQVLLLTIFEAINEKRPRIIPDNVPKTGPAAAIARRGCIERDAGIFLAIEAISG